MRHAPFTQRLARASSQRPWFTLVAWLLIVVVAVVLFRAFESSFRAQDDFLTTPESKRAALLIEQRLPAAQHDTEVVIVSSPTLKVDDPAFRDNVNRLRGELLALGRDEVLAVLTPYAAPSEARALLVSRDQHAALLTVTLAGDQASAFERVAGVLRIATAANGRDGFQVAVTGGAAWGHEAARVAASDLRRAEIIGIPAALIILLVVFGAAATALVPMILAAVAIATASAATAVLGLGVPLTVFAVNMITSMGLAVGIDYSLFTVSRFREERRNGHSVPLAIESTGATANRAVFFSGMTVVLSLLGMLMVPYSAFTSMGAGAICVVLFAVAAALTLLPALLRLLGDRVNALPLPRPRRRARRSSPPPPADARSAGSLWARTAATIMRRPWLSLCFGVALLLAVAAPTFLMQRGVTGVDGLPDRLETKRGFLALSREFSAGWTAPIQVAIDGPVLNPFVFGALNRLRATLAEDGRFTPSSVQIAPSGTLTVVSLLQDSPPTSTEALAHLRDLRERLLPAVFRGVPASVYVGGITAGYVDGLRMIDRFQPIVIAAVLALSFVLLLGAFRSLLVAVTCIAMNILSVGAAYGALVLVFQYGRGANLLGFQRVERVEAYVPVLMFCVLFGLSMDYQVFLLSRIRERYDLGGDSREAVAFGIQSTAGIITGAALIMVAVFAGLASGELVMFQQIGFGLAVAVLLDATVVRTVIAPATIALIGDRYWWLPVWLRWLPQGTVPSRDARRRLEGVDCRHENDTAAPHGHAGAQTE